MGRKYGHDYKRRCIYHITMKKAPGIPDFGTLVSFGDSANVHRSVLGNIVAKRIYGLRSFHPNLRLLQYMVMPDHVHFVLFVTAPIPLHLGNYMSRLKVCIGQDNAAVTGTYSTIFEEDFYDCIIHPGRSLDAVFNYLRANPWRLAVRRANPDFFRRVNNLVINGQTCQAYGNMHLLDNPFKEQVVVHRADTPVQRDQKRHQWLYAAENGGVLVSPFISPAEKAIREASETAGSRIILITAEPFGERFKPAAHNFDLCTSGRLLIISTASILGTSSKDSLTRSQCMTMNRLAASLCQNRINS